MSCGAYSGAEAEIEAAITVGVPVESGVRGFFAIEWELVDFPQSQIDSGNWLQKIEKAPEWTPFRYFGKSGIRPPEGNCRY